MLHNLSCAQHPTVSEILAYHFRHYCGWVHKDQAMFVKSQMRTNIKKLFHLYKVEAGCWLRCAPGVSSKYVRHVYFVCLFGCL